MINSSIKYSGGKKYIRDKLIYPLIKPHKVWVDVCFGGGNVTLGKSPSSFEIANDINQPLINFYEVVQSSCAELIDLLRSFPYSEESFEWSRGYKMVNYRYPIESAAKFFIANRMSRDGMGEYYTWSDRLRRGKPEQISSYESAISNLNIVSERIHNVEFRSENIIYICRDYLDNKDVCLYIDLPYKMGVRNSKRLYDYETTNEIHTKMLSMVKDARCQCIISHYLDDEYSEALKGWTCLTKEFSINMGSAQANNKKVKKLEMCWTNR